MSNRTCGIDGCEKPSRTPTAKYCDPHYMRWYRHGDPLWQAPRKGADLTGQRFGTLTAIRPVAGQGWYCVCDCGATRIARSYALTNHEDPSCDDPGHRRQRMHKKYGEPLGPKRWLNECEVCASQFRGWQKQRFCSAECKTAAPSHAFCNTCGVPAQTSNAKSAHYECRACRGVPPANIDVALTCLECQQTFFRKQYQRFCSRQCRANSQRARRPGDVKWRRSQLDRAAPGIPRHERVKLLTKWKRQGRRCAYCWTPADTIDHVIPLVRGGNNYEGNLIPACRRCNSSKNARTVTEWRYGVPLSWATGAPRPQYGNAVSKRAA